MTCVECGFWVAKDSIVEQIVGSTMAVKGAVRVLLAVRDAGLGQNLSLALDELGHIVLPPPADADEALRQLALAAPDLLIVDLNGDETCGQVLAERLLRSEESDEALCCARHYQKLLESAPLAAVILDRQAQIRYCNEYFAALVNRPKDGLLGANWFDSFVPENDVPARQEMFSKFWEGDGSPSLNESGLKTAAGAIRLIQWEKLPLRNSQGRIIGVAALGRDITEQRSLEERFMQAQKMESVGRLAGSVAHDFNNLLTGIQGNISLAMMELQEEDPLFEILGEVSKAAESATDLTRQLLAFSRKQAPIARVSDLNEVIRDFAKILGRLLGKDIALKTCLCQETALIGIDPGQLQQVLINLAVNARDAMPDGGALMIETASVRLDEEDCRRLEGVTPGPYLRLTLNDEGCGMSQEVQRHLFEPFFTTKERGKGTGLGLATVQGIVKQHKGAIAVHSEMGVGTRFVIYLPREAPKDHPATAVKGDSAHETLPGGKETLWVVESEEIVREPAVKILTRLGYKVRAFADAEAALEALNESAEGFDLLLTDIKLSHENGRPLVGEVASRRPKVKILYTSGYPQHAGLGTEKSAESTTHFLAKPYTPRSLSHKLREVLES